MEKFEGKEKWDKEVSIAERKGYHYDQRKMVQIGRDLIELKGEGDRQVKGVHNTCLKQNIEEKGLFSVWKPFIDTPFLRNLKFYKTDIWKLVFNWYLKIINTKGF